MTYQVWQGLLLACLGFHARFSAGARVGASMLASGKNLGLGLGGGSSSGCDWVCTTHRGSRRGHWTVGKQLPNGTVDTSDIPDYRPRQYFAVHAGGCTAQHMLNQDYVPQVDVVPEIEQDRPVASSSVHIYLSPTLVASLRNRYNYFHHVGVQVCGYDEVPEPGSDTQGACLCEMVLPEPYLSLVAKLPFIPSFVLSKMDQLDHDCHRGVPFLVELALEFMAVCVIAALVYTCFGIVRLPSETIGNEALTEEIDNDRRDWQEPEPDEEEREQVNGPEEEQVDSEEGHQHQAPPETPYAVVIKSPRMCFREYLSKLFGFALIMISLQTLLFEFIMRTVRPLAMYISMGLSLFFSMYSITRFTLVMAQEELVYAALARSIAVTKPPPPELAHYAEWVVMVVFVLMFLALAVRADINHLIFSLDAPSTSGKVAFTTLLALAGPVWRVLREHRRATDTNTDLAKSHVKLNLQGLSALLQQRASEEDRDAVDGTDLGIVGTSWTRLEMALSSGKLRFMPISVMIKAGRRQQSIRETCSWYAGGEGWEDRAMSVASTSTFEARSSDGVKRRYQPWDIHWHGRGVYELTGSRWGFTKIPLLCGAGALLMSVTLFQIVSYACLVPELEMLSLQTAGDLRLDFQPWRYQYITELDVSYRALTMAMSYNRRTTRSVEVDDGGEGSERRGWKPEDVLYVPVDGKFPQVVQIYVESIQGDNWTYSVRLLPTGLLATSLTLTADGNRLQELSLARLPEAVLAIPPSSKEVSVEVFLTDYILTAPVSRCVQPYQSEAAVLTIFCKEELALLRKFNVAEDDEVEHCRSCCRLRGDCIEAFPGRAGGCFFVVLPSNPEEMKAPPMALPRLQSERLQIKQNSSKICLADDRTHCKGSTMNDEHSKLVFHPFDLEEGSSSIRLVLMLGLSPNLQQLHTRFEHFRLQRGMPVPVEVMAHLETWRIVHEADSIEIIKAAPSATAELIGNSYVVTLHDYEPLEVHGEAISLYLAPLLPDPEGYVQWPDGMLTLGGPYILPDFVRCNESRYISNRFNICPSTFTNQDGRLQRWGRLSDVVRIDLDPWQPMLRAGTSFEVRHEATQLSEERRSFQVILRLNGVASPTEWPVEAMQRNESLCVEDNQIAEAKSGRYPLWWPRSGLSALIADAKTMCLLAEGNCTILEYDDSGIRHRDFEPGKLVQVPLAVTGRVSPADLLMTAFLDGYREYDSHRYLTALSCAVKGKGNFFWLQDREFDNRGETLRFIVRDASDTLAEDISISVRQIFQYIVQTDSVDFLRHMCHWVGSNETDASQQVPVLTNMFQTINNANATAREVSSELFTESVLCVAGPGGLAHEMPPQTLRDLAEFAARAAANLGLLRELLVPDQRKWQEAVVAKLIEAQCSTCFRDLKGQAGAKNVKRLELKIRPFNLESTLSAFRSFLVEHEPQIQHLKLTIDGRGVILPAQTIVGNDEARGKLADLANTGSLTNLKNLTLEGFPAWEVGVLLKYWTDKNPDHWKNLEDLSIVHMPSALPSAACSAMTGVLKAANETLRCLNLSGKVLDVECVKQLAWTVQDGTFTRLTRLDISSNLLPDSAGPAMVSVLSGLPNLERGNVSHNALSTSVIRDVQETKRTAEDCKLAVLPQGGADSSELLVLSPLSPWNRRGELFKTRSA